MAQNHPHIIPAWRILAIMIALLLPSAAKGSTALSDLTVNGTSPEVTGNVYTTNEGGTLVITPASPTATVKVAKVRSQGCVDWSSLNTYITPPSSVALPSEAGATNYYYIRVYDSATDETAYYLLKVKKSAADGSQKILDDHIEIGYGCTIPFTTKTTEEYSTDKSCGFFTGNDYYIYAYGGATVNSTNHNVTATSEYLDIGKAEISSDGTPKSGTITLKVGGKGTLKITATNNNGGGSGRSVNVYEGTTSNLIQNFYPDSAKVYKIFDVPYTGNTPTTIFICPTSHATRIQKLEWVPATDDTVTAELVWEPAAGSQSVSAGGETQFRAKAMCDGIDVSNEFNFAYTYQGTTGILSKGSTPLTNGTTITPDGSYIKCTASNFGTATVQATLIPKDGSAFTSNLESTFTVTVPMDYQITVGGMNATEIVDAYVSGVTSVYSTQTAGAFTSTFPASSLSFAAVTNVIAAEPSVLEYSSTAPTVELPAAGSGLINYYYIKFEYNTSTYYLCLEATNPTGTSNGIKVIDKEVHFGKNSSTKFNAAEENITSSQLVSTNPYFYVYASKNRNVVVRPNEIVFLRSGQFEGSTPIDGVIEVRVSGPGTLKVGGVTYTDRTSDQLIIATPEGSGITQLGTMTLPYDGMLPIVYTGSRPQTFYIYPNSTGLRITDIAWEPGNTKTVPKITWTGSSETLVQETCDQYADISNGIDRTSLTYKIIKAGAGFELGSTISSDTNGKPNLYFGQEGTFVISASFAGDATYQAVSMPFTITVSKRVPEIKYHFTIGDFYTIVGGKSRISSSVTKALDASTLYANGQNGTIAYYGTEATAKGVPDGTSKGDFTVTVDGDFARIDASNYIIGNNVGSVTVNITWTPTDPGTVLKYTSVTTSISVPIKPGPLYLSFPRDEINLSTEKSTTPEVIAKNEEGEVVPGLDFTYTLPAAQSLLSINDDKDLITAGNDEGSVEGITATYTGAADENDLSDNYITTSTTNNLTTGAITELTINVEKGTTGRLTLIPDNANYIGSNLASMSWTDETNSSGNDVNLSAPKFVMTHNYMSSDNRFRIDAENNEKLIHDEQVTGVQLTDPASTISFFAQGSARLELSGYSSVARTLEIYAVNQNDYAGNETADPTFDDAKSNLVGSITIPAGSFSTSEINIELAQPGRNYYFLKTISGGIYISSINWVQARKRPWLTVYPNELTLSNSEYHVVSLLDEKIFDIYAYCYDTNKETHESTETKHWIYDNVVGQTSTLDPSDSMTNHPTGQDGNNANANFRFYSLKPEVATVNELTGVITPITKGDAVIYVELEAGDKNITSNGSGYDNTAIKYGSQRVTVTIHIPATVNVMDEWFDYPEVVYSTINPDNSAWQTRCATDTDKGLHIHAHNKAAELDLSSISGRVYFSLQDFNGNLIPSDKAVVYNDIPDGATGDALNDNMTGEALVASDPEDDAKHAGMVNIIDSSYFTGDKSRFRVVARVCCPSYADQQAYYIVNVTNELTIPTVAYDPSIGIKELTTPSSFETPTVAGTSPLTREFFMRADAQNNPSSNETSKADDVVLTFTIPSTTPGLTFSAKILESLSASTSAPSSSDTGSSSPYTLTIPNPKTSEVRYVWVNIQKGGLKQFNAFYKINFLSVPSFSIDGAVDATTRTAQFTSTNSAFNSTFATNYGSDDATFQNIYYSFDSSTPTAESHSGTSHVRESNAVYNVVEAYALKDGFTDGSFTFTTNVLYNMELEIQNPAVYYWHEKGSANQIDLDASWDKEVYLNKEVRVMFGNSDVKAYRNGDFTNCGVAWQSKAEGNSDTGIRSYIDIYKNYNNASEGDGHDTANPYTEYNYGFGGEGSGVGSTAAAPYITPISGAFLRFEAEYNGVVTVWIRQNGASASNAWSKSHDNDVPKNPIPQSTLGLTRRPMYIMDETGTLLQANTAPYSAEWDFNETDGNSKKAYKNINGTVADVSMQSVLDKDFMWCWNNVYEMDSESSKKNTLDAMEYYNKKYGFGKKIPKDANDVANDTNHEYTFDYTKDENKIPIVDIIYLSNPDIDLVNVPSLYGYELPMPNYVRYRIPVKAGKTYYMGGRGTKMGFCGVKFDNDHTTDKLPTYTIDEASSSNSWVSNGTVKNGQQINVKLKRSFSKGKWSPIVLPFSVSESRMRDIFGDGVVVLTLDQYYKYSTSFEMPSAVNVRPYGVEADLMFTHHHYQMLYANTPAYILPDFTWRAVAGRTAAEVKALEDALDYDRNDQLCKTEITFERVTFVAGGVKETNLGSGYILTGSYNTTTASQNGNMYFMSNAFDKENNKYTATLYHSKDGTAMKATRCWISKRGGQNAPSLKTVGVGTHYGSTMLEEDYSFASAIDPEMPSAEQEEECDDPCVYNLQGIVVGKVEGGSSLEAILSRLAPGIYIYQHQKVTAPGF